MVQKSVLLAILLILTTFNISRSSTPPGQAKKPTRHPHSKEEIASIGNLKC
jgi:hypothetical protein